MATKIEKSVFEYLERQRRFKEAEADFNRYKDSFKAEVRSYLEQQGGRAFVVEGKDGRFSVSDVRPTKVYIDPVKLKQKAPEVYRESVVRDVHVDDWEGFSEYMKKLGADPKMVKSFLRVDESIDVKKVDSMIDDGKAKMEDLDGCYDVKVSDGYIRVTEMEI